MGSSLSACCPCFGERDEGRDPILDSQARARAAEAAQARADAYASTPVAKREAKARAKEAQSKGGLSASAHQQRINDILS